MILKRAWKNRQNAAAGPHLRMKPVAPPPPQHVSVHAWHRAPVHVHVETDSCGLVVFSGRRKEDLLVQGVPVVLYNTATLRWQDGVIDRRHEEDAAAWRQVRSSPLQTVAD